MGTKIEVAEQFHRRPLEQIKRKLIESGVFGEVYSSFNDFGGHGYHGVSIMRSYLGFDAVPLSVSGAVASYELAPHVSRLEGFSKARTETQEHGIIRFKKDKLGIFHWTDVGYDSALRWWRSSRFLAEKGMGITTGMGPVHSEQLTLLDPAGDSPMQIRIERRYERVDGGALKTMNAFTGLTDLPLISWENPLCTNEPGWNPHWGDDEISVALCVKSLVDAIRQDEAPSYGAAQACLDQEIIMAIRKSANLGGLPVDLPYR
jgi:predicted dehydrogenase